MASVDGVLHHRVEAQAPLTERETVQHVHVEIGPATNGRDG